MSLINQVLSDLEKRGAGRAPGGSAIRPVAVQADGRKVFFQIAGLLGLLILLGAGLWWGIHFHQSVENSRLATVSLQQEDAPALKLSPELSSIPLSSKRRDKGHGQHTSAGNKTASITAPASNNKVLSTAPAPVVKQPASVDKQIKQMSPSQQAENEFRKANILLQQGHIAEAIPGYAAALQLDAGHDDARQAMVSLLLDRKRNADAETALQEGLQHNPKQIGFAMLLARLQVDRGSLPQALETLQTTLPYAAQQADFQAFLAAVQQRMGLHQEAAVHYRVALQSSPDSAVWLMGLGISLKALQQKDEARAVFKHALESHTLNEDLQAFVTQQLKEL